MCLLFATSRPGGPGVEPTLVASVLVRQFRVPARIFRAPATGPPTLEWLYAVALHVLQYRKHCAAAVSIAYCVSMRRCQSPNNPAKLLVAGYVG